MKTHARPWILGMFLAMGLALPATADDYNAKHDFKLKTSGNQPPVVYMSYGLNTFARTNKCKDPNKDKDSFEIGAGVTTVTIKSKAGDSWADATAEANVTTLVAGEVAGTVEARGNTFAATTGCPPPPEPRGSGYAFSGGIAQISARGQYLDSKGNIRWSGGWKNDKPVSGSIERRASKDPIKARLYDKTTGVTTEWTLLTIKSLVSGGFTAWDGATLSNTADNMELTIDLGAAVTAQAGQVRFVVEGGIVKESVMTGEFAGLGLPDVGAPGAFSVPLPEISIDFDLGADETHDVEVEFDFDNAGEADKYANADGDDNNGSLTTDLGTGDDFANIAELTPGDGTQGYSTFGPAFHIADDFFVPDGPPMFLDAMLWPLYQTGAPKDSPLSAAFVQIWMGLPGFGGHVIAGDMATNRLIDVDQMDLYKVVKDPKDTTRQIKNAYIDLSWAPPLPPGQYYIELATMGLQGLPGPFAPPAYWADQEIDRAMMLDVQKKQWQPARDQQSGRPVSFPFQVFGGTNQKPPCYADIDGDGELTIDDFIAFQTAFGMGDLRADCDGSGELDIDDFICYQGAFGQGCE